MYDGRSRNNVDDAYHLIPYRWEDTRGGGEKMGEKIRHVHYT